MDLVVCQRPVAFELVEVQDGRTVGVERVEREALPSHDALAVRDGSWPGERDGAVERCVDRLGLFVGALAHVQDHLVGQRLPLRVERHDRARLAGQAGDLGAVGVGGAAAVGRGVPSRERVARQGVPAAGERCRLPVGELLVVHRSRNLCARPARGVGFEAHGVGVGIPLGVQRHGRPVLARQVGDLGPVGVGCPAAVGGGVPLRERVALARERAGEKALRLAVHHVLRLHRPRTAVRVEMHLVAVRDGMRFQQHAPVYRDRLVCLRGIVALPAGGGADGRPAFERVALIR